MRFITTTDPLLQFAILSGLAVFLLTIGLLMAIAILRYQIDRRRIREKKLSDRWQPVFLHHLENEPFPVPRIFGLDREIVLLLWIHFVESIRGEARERLRTLAISLKLDKTAFKLFKRRNVRSRLMAIVSFGRMKMSESWASLEPLLNDPNPMLALLVARSLLQIDFQRGLPLILRTHIQRDDWPMAKTMAMLDEVPAETVADPLLRLIDDAAVERMPRLLPLLEKAHITDTWPILEPLLNTEQPVEVIAAALKVCRDSLSLSAVRQLATHHEWVVRAQAAATLGRLGVEEDQSLLLAMLSDSQWWVRYRAAVALTSLPFLPRATLITHSEKLDDRFAADILRQALAETREGATV